MTSPVIVTTLCPLCIHKDVATKNCSICKGTGMIHKELTQSGK